MPAKKGPEPLSALPCETMDLASATLSLIVAAEDLNDGPDASTVREAVATARRHVKRAVRAAEMQTDFASLLSSVLEYAERYADLNEEPPRGGCRKSIRQARTALTKLEITTTLCIARFERGQKQGSRNAPSSAKNPW